MSGTGTRPALHLTPGSGWVNDPLALTWRDDEQGGRYHLFFQHVPGMQWAADCRWGHATSADLLHWEEQPVALDPAPDELGAWSGCLVEDRILYTSVLADDVERGRVRRADPVDSWQRWTAGDVLLEPPLDQGVRYFRDPFVWREGDGWRMLVGAGLADGTGCALGYRSDDLISWEYDGVVASRHTGETDPVWVGAIWECPQLLRLPETDLLLVSVADPEGPGDVVAALGSMQEGRFEVAHWRRLTTGAPYAASAFTDRDDRPGLVAWLRGVAGEGWAGAISAPLVVSVVRGRVALDLHPVFEQRRRAWDPHATAWELDWDGHDPLSLVSSSGEVAARLERRGAEVVVTVEGRQLVLDAGGPVRVLRDGPVLEVLSAGQLAASAITPAGLRPEGRGWRGWSLA